MTQPLVVKFGGDALATPERIVAAARRVVGRRGAQPVVAVASARRGVTDHLLGLVEQVREAASVVPSAAGHVAADRPATVVAAAEAREAADGYAVVLGTGYHGIERAPDDPVDVATISIVSMQADSAAIRSAARAAAFLADGTSYRTLERPDALALLVPAAEAPRLARAIHSAISAGVLAGNAFPRAASARA